MKAIFSKINNILKSPLLNLIIYAALAFVIYIMSSQINSLKSEVNRVSSNYEVAKFGFQKRIDKLG